MNELKYAIMTLEELLLQLEPARAVAETLLCDGALPGITVPILSVGRLTTGAATVSLVFDPLDAGLPWYFELSLENDKSEVRDHLLRAFPEYLAWRGDLKDAFKRWSEVASETLGIYGPGISLARPGVTITWAGRAPTPMLTLSVNARGGDAKPQLVQHSFGHGYDIEQTIRKIAKRDSDARRVAARWKTQGAVGAVEKSAYSVMRASGIELRDVTTNLEWREKFRFDDPARAYEGSFQWRDFAITVDLTYHRRRPNPDCGARLAPPHASPPWKFEKGVLSIPNLPLPEALQGALQGKKLSSAIDLPLLAGDAIIADATVDSENELLVTLIAQHLPFDAYWGVGQPLG